MKIKLIALISISLFCFGLTFNEFISIVNKGRAGEYYQHLANQKAIEMHQPNNEEKKNTFIKYKVKNDLAILRKHAEESLNNLFALDALEAFYASRYKPEMQILLIPMPGAWNTSNKFIPAAKYNRRILIPKQMIPKLGAFSPEYEQYILPKVSEARDQYLMVGKLKEDQIDDLFQSEFPNENPDDDQIYRDQQQPKYSDTLPNPTADKRILAIIDSKTGQPISPR